MMTMTELQAKLGERVAALCNDDISEADLQNEIARAGAVYSLSLNMVRAATLIVNANKSVGTLKPSVVRSVIG